MPITQHHPRQFGTFQHVYPVISRRSDGLSLGVNLSPSGLCNFACVYCQILAENVALENMAVKTDPPFVPMNRLESELRQLVGSYNDGTLFEQHSFGQVPMEKRLLKDIAFSGDGEPTLSPQFSDAVKLVTQIRKQLCADSVKIVLITNATTLHLTPVRSAIEVILQHHGEIWAKLDAGTQDYFQTVSRSTLSLHSIHSNLVRFTRDIPIVVQTCFLSLHGKGPSADEIRYYADRLNELDNVFYVQIYTVARKTPVAWALPLENAMLDDIADAVRQQTSKEIRTFYSH